MGTSSLEDVSSCEVWFSTVLPATADAAFLNNPVRTSRTPPGLGQSVDEFSGIVSDGLVQPSLLA